MRHDPLRFKLYELGVQNPDWQLEYLPRFHRQWLRKAPRRLREDFCGSGKISCEWVKRSPQNQAIGLDIDSEALQYAEDIHRAKLSLQQQTRVEFLAQDVRKPTSQKFDLIGAFNYSCFVFETRVEFLRYARAALRSLADRGTLFLEVAGGQGFLEAGTEKSIVTVPGMGKVEQIWEQQEFDPLSGINDYALHYRIPRKPAANDVFTYHWRIWGIREIREILSEAGFAETKVLWPKSESTDEFTETEDAWPMERWVAYVVGVKR